MGGRGIFEGKKIVNLLLDMHRANWMVRSDENDTALSALCAGS